MLLPRFPALPEIVEIADKRPKGLGKQVPIFVLGPKSHTLSLATFRTFRLVRLIEKNLALVEKNQHFGKNGAESL
jgi:hypothetical protein